MRLLVDIKALASAWARITEEAKFPPDYEGTATPDAHQAKEALRETDDPHAKGYSHEEAMQAVQQPIDEAGNKPC